MELLVNDENIEISENIVKVIGIGGAGNNAVNHMYNNRISGIDYVICNTDIQDLDNSPVTYRIQLGTELTEGLGAGSIPEFGKEAAEESEQELKRMLGGNTRMVILTAGMGGGTGTGATPVVARIAKELGLVVVAIVTTPFGFERKRLKEATKGIEALEQNVDSLLVINNQKLQHIYGDLSFPEACEKANDVLVMAAKSISEIYTKTSLQNIDYSDLERVLRGSGMAVFGVGRAKGAEDRVGNAIEEALYSPLLDNCDIIGAQNLLVNIVVGDEKNYTLAERQRVGIVMERIAGKYRYMKYGIREDKSLAEDELVITIVATNFNRQEKEEVAAEEPEIVATPVESPLQPKTPRPEIEMVIEDTRKKEEEQREKQAKKVEKQKREERKDPIEEIKKKRTRSKRRDAGPLQGFLDFITAKDADDIDME